MNKSKKAKYEIMPAHTPEAYVELKASIAERGRVEKRPIYDEEGNLLDGFARERICDELGDSLTKGSSSLWLGSGKIDVRRHGKCETPPVRA